MPRAIDGQKLCTGCDQIKHALVDNFSRSSSSADGLRSNCRVCERVRSKAAYAANPEREREHSRRYRVENRDKHLINVRASHWKHREKRIAYNKKHYADNREKHLCRAKVYREANRPRVIEGQRIWRAALRAEMHAAYGNQCSCCGETESRFLTLEHLFQTGGEHRKLMGGQVQIYCDLRRRGWPKDGFTLLCWNCNLATRDGSKCPHQIKRDALICEAVT